MHIHPGCNYRLLVLVYHAALSHAQAGKEGGRLRMLSCGCFWPTAFSAAPHPPPETHESGSRRTQVRRLLCSSVFFNFFFYFCRSPQSIWLLEQNVNEPERRRRGAGGEAVVNSRRSRVWRACACTYMLLPSFLFFFLHKQTKDGV